MNYDINYLVYGMWFWYNSLHKVLSVHVRDSNMLLVFMSTLILAYPHTGFCFQASKVQDIMDRWSTIYSLAWCWLQVWILAFSFYRRIHLIIHEPGLFSLTLSCLLLGKDVCIFLFNFAKIFYFLVNCKTMKSKTYISFLFGTIDTFCTVYIKDVCIRFFTVYLKFLQSVTNIRIFSEWRTIACIKNYVHFLHPSPKSILESSLNWNIRLVSYNK